jgi:DNA repair ATPase RecN
VDASDDQLKRVETMYKQLEQRRSQLAFSEKKIAAFESRIAELKQLTDHVDKQIDGISSREGVVSAVKAEVDSVHHIGARSKADLQYVAEHRAELSRAEPGRGAARQGSLSSGRPATRAAD